MRWPPHLTQPGVHDLGVAGQRGGADPRRLIAHPLEHVLGGVDHTAGDRVGHRLQHDQIAKALQQIGGEPPRVMAGVDHPLDRSEQRRGVARGQRVDRVVDQRHVGGTQQRKRPRVADLVAVRARQQLIEHRERVAG